MIEQTMPNWPEARKLIRQILPSTIEFEASPLKADEIVIKREWFRTMIAAVPDLEYFSFMNTYPQQLDRMIAALIPTKELFTYVNGKEMGNQTFETMNCLMRLMDADRAQLREPTTLQLLMHVFGLEHAGPVTVGSFKLTVGS